MNSMLTKEDFSVQNRGKTLSYVISQTHNRGYSLSVSIPPPDFHEFSKEKGYNLKVSSTITGDDIHPGWKIVANQREGIYTYDEVKNKIMPTRKMISDLSIGKTIKVAYHDPIDHDTLNKHNAEEFLKTTKYANWLIHDFENFEFLGVAFE